MAVLKDLIVHGSSRFINVAYFNSLGANKISANEGVFNKLIATNLTAEQASITDLSAENAKITGILDVTEGELHTNTWTNASIATVGGSLYITPTLESESGSFAMTSATDITFSSPTTNFDWSNLYTGDSSGEAHRSWSVGSKVLITGEVAGADGILLPLGTLKGDVKTISNTTLRVENITDAHNHVSTILTNLWSSRGNTYANLKVSIYQWNDANNTKFPLGIYITALGTNGKTFLDIYGGYGNAYTTSYGGLALPNLRIGNLNGLPMVGNITPQGWGIYTNNGFFTGTIVARQGKIGNGNAAWTIGNDSNTGAAYIYTGTLGVSPSAYISTGYGTTSIADSGALTNDKKWVFTAGDKFGVTNEGDLYASNAKISGKITVGSGSNVYTIDEADNAFDERGAAYQAQTNAISAAAADATDKANVAQAAAELAAATDATNKADKAATTASNYIDDLGEGGTYIYSSNTQSKIQLSQNGIFLYNGNNIVAQYTNNIILGGLDNIHIELSALEGLGFYQGRGLDNRVAYINQNKLFIEAAEIKNELRIGPFIWKVRDADTRISLRYEPRQEVNNG